MNIFGWKSKKIFATKWEFHATEASTFQYEEKKIIQMFTAWETFSVSEMINSLWQHHYKMWKFAHIFTAFVFRVCFHVKERMYALLSNVPNGKLLDAVFFCTTKFVDWVQHLIKADKHFVILIFICFLFVLNFILQQKLGLGESWIMNS